MLSPADCLAIGGHCWEYDQTARGYPKLRQCKHCGDQEIGSPLHGDVWRNRLVERVETAIARQTGIAVPLMQGARRGTAEHSYARHLAWYVLVDRFSYPNAFVARAYDVDHSSVFEGRRVIAQAMKHGIDDHVAKDIDAVVAEVNSDDQG